MQHNAATRRDVREAEKAAAQAERNRREIISTLAGQPAGRRYLWAILEEAGLFRDIFHESHAAMAYAEGRRSMGRQLLNDLVAFAPDDFTLMLKEANNERSLAIAKRSRSEGTRWDAEAGGLAAADTGADGDEDWGAPEA